MLKEEIFGLERGDFYQNKRLLKKSWSQEFRYQIMWHINYFHCHLEIILTKVCFRLSRLFRNLWEPRWTNMVKSQMWQSQSMNSKWRFVLQEEKHSIEFLITIWCQVLDLFLYTLIRIRFKLAWSYSYTFFLNIFVFT